jgi:hypothetical protein
LNNNDDTSLGICELCYHNRPLSDFTIKKSKAILRICDICNTIDSSNFFDTKIREYLSDTQVEDAFSELGVDSKGRIIDTVMVCDLHNVTDLFSYEEFNNITKNFNVPVIVLSFIPIKSETRKRTQPIINEYNSYKTFMCFSKAYTPAPGTKGRFIQNIFSNSNIKNVFLLDDNNMNCVSGKKAGGTSILIPNTRKSDKSKEEIKVIIEDYMRKINNIRKRPALIRYIQTLGFFNNEIRRKKRSANKKKKTKNAVISRKKRLTSAEIEELKKKGKANKLSRKKKKESAAAAE